MSGIEPLMGRLFRVGDVSELGKAREWCGGAKAAVRRR